MFLRICWWLAAVATLIGIYIYYFYDECDAPTAPLYCGSHPPEGDGAGQ